MSHDRETQMTMTDEPAGFEKINSRTTDHTRFRFSNTLRRKLRDKKTPYSIGMNARHQKAIRW
jgi:hypothetical protein